MSAAKFAYFQELTEFVKRPVFAGSGLSDLERELKENALCIEMTATMAKECSVSDLLRFFDLLIEDRRMQLKKNHGRKMRFYAWFDEESGQLRGNLISLENLTIALNAEIKNSSLIEVLAQFLNAKKSGEKVLAAHGASNIQDAGMVSTPPALKVFQVVL